MSSLSHKTTEILTLVLDELTDVFDAEYIDLLFDGIIKLDTFSTMIYSDQPHNMSYLSRLSNVYVVSEIVKYLQINSTEERLAGLTKAVTHNGSLRNAVNDYLKTEDIGVPVEQFFLYASPFIFGTKNSQENSQ